MDELLFFDYDLRILSCKICKTSYIKFGMNSLKIIVWFIWDHISLVLKNINSPFIESFLSLVQTKDYTYMIIDGDKVLLNTQYLVEYIV